MIFPEGNVVTEPKSVVKDPKLEEILSDDDVMTFEQYVMANSKGMMNVKRLRKAKQKVSDLDIFCGADWCHIQ